MPSSGIFELVALAAGAVQSDDALAIVDVHDATQSAQGSTKKVTLANLYTLATTPLTVSTPMPNITQAWNSGGVTFTAVKLNVTDTASAAASLLIDLQVGAASKFSVTKAGNGVFGGTLTVTGNLTSSAITLLGAAIATAAAAGELVLANAKQIRGENAGGTTTYKMLTMGPDDTVALAGATSTLDTFDTYVRVPYSAATTFPAGSATKNGILSIDGTNNRLVFYSGGARYYLTGTAF